MLEPILSPLDYFLNTAKQAHSDNTRAYLNLLCEHAGVDRTANAQTVAKYNAKQKHLDGLRKSVSGNKTKRTLSIIGIIIAFFLIIGICGSSSMESWAQSLIMAVSLIIGIVGIVIVCKKFGAKIKALDAQVSASQEEANTLYREAISQVAPLNRLFTDDDCLNLVTKTLPFITFDKCFTDARLNELVSDYGFNASLSGEECVLDTLSGELYGSPFLYLQTLRHEMGWETYHGSTVISWTTTERDSQGNLQTRTHTQTLHASITRPKPYFHTNTTLYFGNKACPNVNFSRTYKHMEDKSNSAIDRAVRAGEKKIRRKEEKALKTGDDFMGTLNVEFDVIFGATNRTDDYEFRQMFTVRAQESMLQLLLHKEGYGDDFSFVKQGTMCAIQSEHAQGKPLSVFAPNYYSHDVTQAENAFIQHNETFFQSVYFDFAPLLLIPVYQQPLVRSRAVTGGNLTAYNYDAMAYRISSTAPSDSNTSVIYKTALQERSGGGDAVHVSAFGYRAEARLHYESVYGNDGHWHDVPIEWVEYVPTQKNSIIKIVRASGDAPEGAVSHRGYYAYEA